MRSEFTRAQAAEITNTFWHIALDDGAGNSLGFYDDDIVNEIPTAVLVGILGEIDTDGDGTPERYACEHPDLTDEDVTLIKYELDWRAGKMAAIAALPSGDRAAARTALRTEIRQAARADARRASRVALRVADRVAARQAYRADLKQAAIDAGVLKV